MKRSICDSGTYPLPESQMDRFMLRIRLDYPVAEDEKHLLLQAAGTPSETLARVEPVLAAAEVRALQDAADRVRMSAELAEYVVTVAQETRRSPFLALGLSPRAELAWRNAARGVALADGRDFILPDDLKRVSMAALAHRLVLRNQTDSTGRAREEAERALAEILNRVPVPG